MRIVQFTAENIKRLKAVHIEPSGNVITIGGRNAQGKSSVLDAIAMAIGGTKLVPEKPVRTGAERAFTEVDLGDYVVRRTFTAQGGTSLTVKSKDGSSIKSPQTLLDQLIGRLSFDPLAFARLGAQGATGEKAQQEMLRQIVGLDTSALEQTRASAFAERTEVNRRVTALTAQLAQMPAVEDGVEEVSVSELVAQLSAADKVHADARVLGQQYEREAAEWKRAREAVEGWDKQIADLEQRLTEARNKKTAAEQDKEALKPRVIAARDAYNRAVAALPDRDAIKQAIATADLQNAKAREAARRAQLAKDLEGVQLAAAALTDQLAELDAQKAEAIASVQYPVPGLAFDDAGRILFNGEPFAQASTSEQLRVSVAIGMALNPTLRVLLVRNGNDLDAESLRLLAELAAAHDAQVWVERVAESADGVSVLIEDGEVAGDAPKKPIPPGPENRRVREGQGPSKRDRAIQAEMDAPQFRITNTDEFHEGFIEFGEERRAIKPGAFVLAATMPTAKSPCITIEALR